jgi:hypothetical protein
LKLLEEATMSEGFQFSLLKEKLLPDLKQNIICGNSLIETDIETQTSLFEEHTPSRLRCDTPLVEGTQMTQGEKKHKHNAFPSGEGNRRGVSDVEDLKPMNFADAFPEIMRRGGFDAIVGNPPYSTVTDGLAKDYLETHYETVEGRYDTFELFIERGAKLIRQKGSLGFIIPSPLLSNLYSRRLRRFLLDNYSIQTIANFGMDVFSDPTVHTCIIVFSRQTGAQNLVRVKKQIMQIGELNSDPDFLLPQSELGNNENATFDIFVDPSTQNIFEMLSRHSQALGEICYIRQCIKTGNDSVYVKQADAKPGTQWKPTLRGRSIGRYLTKERDFYLKYGSWLARNWKNTSFYETPKIAIRETGNRIVATFDPENRYLLSSLYAIYFKSETDQLSLLYLLGILNSSLATYCVRKFALELTKGAFTKMRTNQLAKLPIHTINFSDPTNKSRHDNIVKLVAQMLAAKEKLAKAKTDAEVNRLEMHCAALDRQIDTAVYELYGLTEEEIGVAQGG